MVEKRGRPSRRQLDEQAGSAIWQRLVDDATSRELDYRITTQIGRLRLQRLLSDAQAAAGDVIGRIYGRYEKMIGRTRTTRSPSYEFTTAPGRDRDEPSPWDPGYDEWIERITRTNGDYDAVQDCIEDEALRGNVREIRDIIERLCVENQSITSLELRRIYGVLNRVSELFRLGPEADDEEDDRAIVKLAPTPKRRPPKQRRETRRQKLETGAYAAGDGSHATHHAPGSAGERDHANLVRLLEERQAQREKVEAAS